MEKQQLKIEVGKQAFALTNMIVGHNEEQFDFVFASGHVGTHFVSTPAHAKRIALRLGEQIAEYEKKYGEIKVTLPKINKNETADEKKIGF